MGLEAFLLLFVFIVLVCHGGCAVLHFVIFFLSDLIIYSSFIKREEKLKCETEVKLTLFNTMRNEDLSIVH